MGDDFKYDVFLSHSSKDKAVVRAVAERLQADGLRVWFDEWEIRAGDSIPAKIEEGLEHSRVLVLCMSANAFGSDWTRLESYTFRFRDPLNKERRFIPLRLDEAPIKGSLAQFLHINWLLKARKQEYAKLLEACRPLARSRKAPTAVTHKLSAEKISTLTHFPDDRIRHYEFSPDRKRVLTIEMDGSIQVWEVPSGRYLHEIDTFMEFVIWSPNSQQILSTIRKDIYLWIVGDKYKLRSLKGHSDKISCLDWSPNGKRILSASWDETMRIWDVESGGCLCVIEDNAEYIEAISWSSDNKHVLSGDVSGNIQLWNLKNGSSVRLFQGHKGNVNSVAWSGDQQYALSGGKDSTMRLWEVTTGRCLRVFEGHSSEVYKVSWSRDQRHILSSSYDGTSRLWKVETGRCEALLRNTQSQIINTVWDSDYHHAISGDLNGNMWRWDLTQLVTQQSSKIKVRIPPTLNQVQYTNAKAMLVGENGVGKTGLSNRLARDFYKETDSTDGAWATQWKLPHNANKDGVEREIWLWDFAGQVDYRLVHQLFMEDTAAAVLVFNPQNENPFEGLGQWDRDLQKAARKPFAKLLAAGRIDRGGLIVSQSRMEKFLSERGFRSPLHLTSAKTGEGCEALRDAIITAIDWQNIPETTSPVLYHRLKQEILSLRDSGLVLIRLAELKQRMELVLLGERFELAELQTVVGLLAGPGMIQSVDFGGFILLRPEVLSRYAAAVVRQVRKHPQELGCIREDKLLAGALDYQDFERLPAEDEAVVLRTLHETLVSRAWCLRQPCDGSALLTFPSYFRRERPMQPSHPNVLVTYRFCGHIEDLYATLVVRLHHTEAFDADQLWKDAADFKTQTGQSLGLKLTREAEGAARLDVYFNPNVDENSRVVFLRYVHNHLTEHAQDVVRLRRYVCGWMKCESFNQPFTDQAKIDKALASGKDKVFCPDCGKPIVLRDVLEQKFDSPAVKKEARIMHLQSQLVIDNESRELILVGHALTITAEAGQIFRPTPNSDYGIDGEIEFKDDQGRATGKRLYLQLRARDSYLMTRKRDGTEVFQIKNERCAEYWQHQAYPVLLVIRTSDGEIRWMDVSDYLKRAQQPVKRVVFAGERFDVMSVRRWRDAVLK